MPELPEVETITNDLRQKILGLIVKKIIIHDGRVIRKCSHSEFCRRLEKQNFQDIYRRGKAIVLTLSPSRDFLIIQLGMTGQCLVFPDSSSGNSSKEAKVIFQLSNRKSLHYNDQRMFGRLQIVSRLEDINYFKTIGPEPLGGDFTSAWLKKELSKRTLPIKPLLLNQNFVAGIGNIYASEILFASRIHPAKPANGLNYQEAVLLCRNTRRILREAIRCRGTSMNTYRDAEGQKGTFISRIKVYGRDKEPCPSCKKVVLRMIQSGRSTFFCEHCQK